MRADRLVEGIGPGADCRHDQIRLCCAAVAVLIHFRGRPGFGVARVLSGLAGGVVMVAGAGLGLVGVILVRLGFNAR